MRNIMTNGIGLAGLARPKTKEAGLPNAVSAKENATYDFQRVLNTAYGETVSNGNSVSDGKAGKVKPEKVKSENRDCQSGMNVAKGKDQTVKTLETGKSDSEAPVDLPTADEVQSTTAMKNATDAHAVVPEELVKGLTQLVVATPTESDDSDSKTTDETEPPVAPEPTPQQPKVTKINPALVAATQPIQPVILNTAQTVKTDAIKANTAESIRPVVDVKLPTAAVAFATPMPKTISAQTANSQSQTNQATVTLAGTVAGKPTTMADMSTNIPSQPEIEPMLNKTGTANVEGALTGKISATVATEPVNGSNVVTAQPVIGLDVANTQSVLDRLPQPLVNLANRLTLETALTATNDITGKPETGTPVVPAATAAFTGAVAADQANNLNMVMAGTSLGKNVMPSTSAANQPHGENLTVIQSLASQSVPGGMLLTPNNRFAKNQLKTMEFTGNMTIDPNLATETTPEKSTLTGLGQLTLRQAAELNRQEATAGEPAGAIMTGQEANQAGVQIGVSAKATVTSDTKQTISAGSRSDELEVVKKTSSSSLELPGAATATVQERGFQIQQASLPKETSAASKTEIFTQIVEQAKLMVHQGQSEMEMSLKPEHLGKLKLRIAVEHQVVTAQFTVESEQVKQIIETNLVQLRKMLQDAGTEVHNLTVSVGQQSTNANYSQQSHNGGSGSQTQHQSQTLGNLTEQPVETETNRASAKANSVVDLIA